jgi:beta-glucosidase
LQSGGFKEGVLEVTVDVTNTGTRSGEETVLLFIRDDYASMTRPVKELKAFSKIILEPGETKTVRLSVQQDQLQFWGADEKWRVEPGTFTVMVDTLFASVEL